MLSILIFNMLVIIRKKTVVVKGAKMAVPRFVHKLSIVLFPPLRYNK